MGRRLAGVDPEIAALARSRASAVATRDMPGFGDCGVSVLNPWMGRKNRERGESIPRSLRRCC
jgi:hypothetical protein